MRPILLVMVMSWGVGLGCVPSVPGEQRSSAELAELDVVPMAPMAPASCEIPGVIGAARARTLHASVSGRIRLVKGIEPGSPLTAGDLVATVQTREDAGRHAVVDAALRSTRARAKTQQAEVAAAQRKHAQLVPLAAVESRATLADAHDEVVRMQARHHAARTEISQATAARDQAEARADFGALRAPFAGAVVLLHVADDQLVQSGERVALVRDDTRRILRFAVDPDAVVDLEPGSTIRYQRTTDGAVGEATVEVIPASSDPRTGLVLVEARLPPTETAREGTSAHVELPAQAAHWCTRQAPPSRQPV